jgi:quinohemoprotein amine dehydrogenase
MTVTFHRNAARLICVHDLLFRLAGGLALCILFAGMVSGQSSEEGIPVNDPLAIAKCGTCHARDQRGNMQRISWARTTPENWQDELKRMILVHGLSLTQPEARSIIRYLSTFHGLAPDEARPIMYAAERRIHDEAKIANDELRNVCAKCHAFALPLSWRRSPAEWKQFFASHSAGYKIPVKEDAVEFFVRVAPLHSAEWDAWSGRAEKPDLPNRWLLTASLPGRGVYYGEMRMVRAGEDEFETQASLTSLKDGSKIVRSGRSAVYAGYSWRGRSKGMLTGGSSPDDPASEAREVLWIAPDQSTAEGRWFWGEYQEFGFDVRFKRASSDPTLMVVDRQSLKTGSQANRVRMIGANFPAHVTPADVDFGPGLTVSSVASHTTTEITAEVDVAAGAQVGRRDVRLGGSVLPGAIAIYERMDYVKVTPESAVAAFGDSAHARGYQPFEAIGFQRGADGRLHTTDDMALGPVEVTWSVQVFHAAEDSSSDIVGTMNHTGLFRPATSNPNNNFDCWVIATARNEKDQDGAPLVGKSFMVVTVPAYTINGRRYVRDLDRWVDDGPASGQTGGKQ